MARSRGARRMVLAKGLSVNPLLLMLVVCPLLGTAVFASVALLAFTLAQLPRLWLKRRSRTLESA